MTDLCLVYLPHDQHATRPGDKSQVTPRLAVQSQARFPRGSSDTSTGLWWFSFPMSEGEYFGLCSAPSGTGSQPDVTVRSSAGPLNRLTRVPKALTAAVACSADGGGCAGDLQMWSGNGNVSRMRDR